MEGALCFSKGYQGGARKGFKKVPRGTKKKRLRPNRGMKSLYIPGSKAAVFDASGKGILFVTALARSHRFDYPIFKVDKEAALRIGTCASVLHDCVASLGCILYKTM